MAKEIGVSHAAIQKWIKNPAWPFGQGPWPPEVIEQAKTWRDEHLRAANESGQTDPADETSVKKIDLELKLLQERILEKQISRAIKEGSLVNRKDVEDREVRQVMVVKQALLSVKTLGVKMEGMTAQQREALLEKWARDTCDKFANARIASD